MRRLKFAVGLMSLTVITALAGLVLVATALPLVMGWDRVVLTSGSMRPLIDPGDVVITTDVEHPVTPGTVVVFKNPNKPGSLITHRVLEVLPEGSYRTKGDANPQPDLSPVTPDMVIGRGALLVPSIGLPAIWIQKGHTVLAAAAAAVVLLLAGLSRYGLLKKHEPWTSAQDRNTREARPRPRRRVGIRASTGILLAAGLAAGSAGVAPQTAHGALAAPAQGMQNPPAGAAVFSSAAFTASTASAANTFSAAADWTAPAVTMTGPGTTLRETATVAAEAADAETGIREVVIQYLPAGGTTWIPLCAVAAAPYSCAWNTRTVTDGAYSLRAVATDNTGLTSTSVPADTTVVNTFSVVLADPGEILRGTLSLATTLHGPGPGKYTVRVEYSPAGDGNWKTACTSLSPPYTCTWNTATLTGDYDLRSVAVTGTTPPAYSATVADVLVDNTAPTVKMTDPGTPLSGTRTFAAAAADEDSGVSQVQIQYARTGTAWATLCTVADEPHSCRFDTATLARGTYSFRATATDAAGNSTTSATVANRVIDNTVSSVSVEDPGAYLAGIVTLTAAANSTAGVGSVQIQTAPAGTGMWTTPCTLAAAPFTCSWDTRPVTAGLYDFRAVLTDRAGTETVSATVTARRVDNSPLRGTDIQTTSGSATPGTLSTGDTISFTYSQQVNPATLIPGWNGTAKGVTVRLRDGKLLGLGRNDDTLDVQLGGSSVNLGTVNLKQNYARQKQSVQLNAAMAAATVTVSGIPRTVVTITLGTVPGSAANLLRPAQAAAAMIWSPSAAAATPAGSPSSTASVTETGASDKDF